MPGQHKHPPLRFRPPEAERSWLLDYAKRTGTPVNAVLTAAVAALRGQVEGELPASARPATRGDAQQP